MLLLVFMFGYQGCGIDVQALAKISKSTARIQVHRMSREPIKEYQGNLDTDPGFKESKECSEIWHS